MRHDDRAMHLRHGPIDCLVRAWGRADETEAACRQAEAALPAILPALVAELPRLRAPLPSLPPRGDVARAMHAACAPYADRFITPMAAVAGAVADHLLRALARGRALDRAFVNNGGDIAVHLAPGETLCIGMIADLAAPGLTGTLTLDRSCGVATSGRACKGQGGRSFSFGIADAVTVIARSAAAADAAATVIANAVDLPGHPAIRRRAASSIDPDSDLGDRAITWDVGALAADEIAVALDAGRRVADALVIEGRIDGAALMLRGQAVLCGHLHPALEAS
jgi:ApbE superfamily uncharacterized protein (UPF0280 family)